MLLEVKRDKMITSDQIEEVKNRLVLVFHPEAIYLFGSYAWGEPTEDSDLDILVIVQKSDEKMHKRAFPASMALIDLMIPKDVLVYTKDEFDSRKNEKSSLSYKVLLEGKKIYERI
jgi:predicted nucleotidyltransferase